LDAHGRLQIDMSVCLVIDYLNKWGLTNSCRRICLPRRQACVCAPAPYDWAKVCAHSRSVQININRCGNTQLCGVYTSGDRVDNKLFTHRIMKGRLTCRNQTSSRKRTTGVWTDTFTARTVYNSCSKMRAHEFRSVYHRRARARARTGAIYGCGLNQ
jgi:hypothetical protein